MRFPRRLIAALAIALGLATLQPAAAADDPFVNHQWGLTQVHAPAAWSVSTGSGIKIGIVDSGVNRNHEDLVGKVIASATCVNTTGKVASCTTGSGDGNDINGHGTHVAGIAAALAGNGTGIAGVAPSAKLIVARAFAPDPNGGEPTANVNDVKAAIEWVVAQGAQIVNLSLGTDQAASSSLLCSPLGSNPLRPSIEDAWSRGALPILASGNNAGSSCYGNLDAIVVGATGPDGGVESYSTSTGGAKWSLVAPGGDITSDSDPRCTDPSRTDCPMVLSTFALGKCQPPDAPNCYAYLAGTSMATPHVSGAAALLFAHGLTRQEVIDTLLATTDPIDCGSKCSGRLNVARAVGAVPNETNSGGGTTTTTAKKKTPTSSGGTTSGATTTSPTTSPFTFNAERPGLGTTVPQPPRGAIVLNTQPADDSGVPVIVGLAGIVSLAIAALAMSYNLRKTLTTLP
jgi:subtilisin family serine protease